MISISVELLVQHMFNALALGSLYGLIAIGYTMVYGILRLINFAHGDIFMLGAYLVFFSSIAFMPAWSAVLLLAISVFVFYAVYKPSQQAFPLWFLVLETGLLLLFVYFVFYSPADFKPPWLLAVAFAVFVTSACGIVVDRAAYRPLRDAPRISALISAIGVSFLLENLAVVVFSGLPRAVLQPDLLTQPILLPLAWVSGKADSVVRVNPMALLAPLISLVLVSLLLWVIFKTKPGLAMRSISKDIETTRLMGVSVDKIIALTFALGSALAAASGIMWALRYPQIHPYMGVLPGFKAFIAAVCGGIGSIQGALLGGLMLGFIEVMLTALFPHLSGYRDAFAFVLLVLVLLWRPTGILGEKFEEKI